MTEDAPPSPGPTATSAISPTPGVVRGIVSDPDDPCGISLGGYSGEYHEGFFHWSGDGSFLVFDVDDEIWALDMSNSRVRKIADVDPDYREEGDEYYRYTDYRFLYGFYADVSPDGLRIVYSTCEYEVYPPSVIGWSHRGEGNIQVYEIGTVNIDGGDKERSTESVQMDNYPVWSPDGTQVAFISGIRGSAYDEGHYEPEYSALHIKWVEDGELRAHRIAKVLRGTTGVALYPPVWSPDGRYLAYLFNRDKLKPFARDLYIVKADGSEETGLEAGKTVTAPADWSPDGRELAFASIDEESPIIYAVMPDGTGLRTVWRSGYDGPYEPISQVSWSPDGSELLFVSGSVYVVGSDGSSLRLIEYGARAAWSPDGSRVAVYQPGYQILIAARDGTDVRPLAMADANGIFHAVKTAPSVGPAACSAGVVPDPDTNPGLVRDCEVLLNIRDSLDTGEQLNWSGSVPMGDWDGVVLAGSPPRVYALVLLDRDLTGILPPELGELAELRTLNLSGNYLTGSIPQELSNLSSLNTMSLSGNQLTGCIPIDLRYIESTDLAALGLPNCE